jgi:hypothetical protein
MLYIVMEYADGGDLSMKVKAQATKHKAFAEPQVCYLLTVYHTLYHDIPSHDMVRHGVDFCLLCW